jgi:glycine hydroxymethyltransferase
MQEREMEVIAGLIAEALDGPDEGTRQKIRERVAALCAAFPLYE